MSDKNQGTGLKLYTNTREPEANSAQTIHEIRNQDSTLLRNILHQRLDMVKFVMASNKTKFNLSNYGGTEKQCLSLENVLHRK